MITVQWKNDRPALDTIPLPSRKHGILIVEGDEGLRTLLNTWLMDQGYGVWMAATGLEAIDLYTHNRDAISVVLLDVDIPEMDGPHTLVALRELNPRICCCFMNGNHDGYSEMDLLNMGAESVLRKPFRMTELDQMLWKYAAPIERQSTIQDDLWRDDGGQG